MNDFTYGGITEYVYGKGAESRIGDRLKAFGAKKVLICYGRGSVEKSGLLKRVTDSLTQAGISFLQYGGVSANPHKTHALSGIAFAKENGADFILAVGGGSVIDEAKCIAVGCCNDDPWAFYTNARGKGLEKAFPLAAVLTIPAAGSEGSGASVIRDEKTGYKYAIESDCIRPRFAFVNPELMFTLPKHQIANGASDILAHLLERYFSPQANVMLTDKLLTGAMQAMFAIAPKVYADSQNYGYWSELCLLGTLAHNGMLALGRDEQDWATHNIENTFLSGRHNIAHGAGLAIIFPAWLKLMTKKRPEKVYQFCQEVMGAGGKTDVEIMEAGIAKLETFYRSLNLPVTLRDVSIQADELMQSVKTVYPQKIALGGYGRLTQSEIEEVIRLAR